MILPNPQFALQEKVTYTATGQRGITTMCYRTPEKIFYDVLAYDTANILVKIPQDSLVAGHMSRYDEELEKWVE